MERFAVILLDTHITHIWVRWVDPHADPLSPKLHENLPRVAGAGSKQSGCPEISREAGTMLLPALEPDL